MSGVGVGVSPRIFASLIAMLVSGAITAFMISQSFARYNNRMSLYEEGCEAEHHLKLAEAERLWRAALKNDMDDVRCDPFYLATDWGLFYPSMTNIRPFGGRYDVIAECHLAHVLCSRAVYYQTPLSNEIEGLYKHGLQIWRSTPGAERKGTFRIQNQLAELYALQGRDCEAEVMYRETLEAQIKELGEGDYDTVRTRDRLEALYEFDKHYSDAEALLNEDLRLSKQPMSYCQREWTLYKLALLYYEDERYKDAAPLFEESLKKDAFQAEQMHYLGLTDQHLGRNAEAEALYKKALHSNEEHFDYDPDFAASTMTDLALLNMSQRRYAAAEPLLTNALRVSKLLIDDDPSVLVLKERLRNIDVSSQALAKLYFLQGRDATARSLLNEVGELMKSHRFATIGKFDKLCMLERQLFEAVSYPKEWIVQTTRLIPKGCIIRASDLEKIEVFGSRLCVGELHSPLPAVGRRAGRDIAEEAVITRQDLQWEPRSACTDSAAVEREIQIASQKWTTGQDALAEERSNKDSH